MHRMTVYSLSYISVGRVAARVEKGSTENRLKNVGGLEDHLLPVDVMKRGSSPPLTLIFMVNERQLTVIPLLPVISISEPE